MISEVPYFSQDYILKRQKYDKRSTILQSRLYSLNDRNMISEVPYFSQDYIFLNDRNMISEVPYFSQDYIL